MRLHILRRLSLASVPVVWLGMPLTCYGLEAPETNQAGQAEPVGQRVSVKLRTDPAEVHGTLLELGPDIVRVRAGRRDLSWPLASVHRIDLRRADSVLDGAAIGGLVAALWCGGYACAEAPSRTRAVLQAAGIGALIGAAIDYSRSSRTTIYVAPVSTVQRSEQGLVIGIRVAF